MRGAIGTLIAINTIAVTMKSDLDINPLVKNGR
jgi:hypothetical protein